MRKNQIIQKRLKEILHYDPETGIFRWLVTRGGRTPGTIAGSINKLSGYRHIRINGKIYRAARLAHLYVEGYFPEHDMDHRDRNKNNDAWENLRHVSRLCNTRNRKIHCNNTSGITGVHWSKKDNTWIALIGVKYLGCFNNLIDAVKARWEAEKKYDWSDCNTTSSAFNFLQEASDFKD